MKGSSVMDEMNQERKESITPPTNESEKSEGAQGSELSLFRRARQHTNIILISCCVIFLIVYLLVNIKSIAGIFSSVFTVFTPILLGGAFAYLLNPLLKLYEYKVFKKLKSKKLLRVLSLLMTYVTAIAVIVALAFLLIPQLVDSIVNFVQNINTYLNDTSNFINNFLSKLIGNNTEIVDQEMILGIVKNFLSQSGDVLGDIASYVLQYGTGLVIGIKNFILAIFISIYVLASKERLKAQTNKLVTAIFSKKAKKRFYRYTYLCNRVFGRYFTGMIVDSILVGIITFILLTIAQIPYALLVSCIVCVTNVIPVFGPFIGAIPSFLIIFIVNPPKAFLFLLFALIVQQIDGNVLAPKIHGNSTGLSSLGVIISIIIMGEYFGLIGMVLGVPLFAVIVNVFKEILESKLSRKKCPTQTAEYYENDSLVDPYEQHETLFVKLSHHLGPKAHAKAKNRQKQKQEKKAECQKKKSTETKTEKENENL